MFKDNPEAARQRYIATLIADRGMSEEKASAKATEPGLKAKAKGSNCEGCVLAIEGIRPPSDGTNIKSAANRRARGGQPGVQGKSELRMQKLVEELKNSELSDGSKRVIGSLTTLQAFIDDSKSGDMAKPGSVFVLAGYISSVSEWLTFSDEWQAILDMPPALDKFKMSHFVHRFGMADERLVLFRRAIERSVRGAITASVDMDVYRRFVAAYPPKTIQNPYYLLLLDMIIQLKRAAPLIKLDGKIEFIFDDQLRDKDVIKYTWSRIPETRPDIAKFIGNEPKWEKEEEFLPLQAADAFAWWVRRHREDHLAGRPMTEIPWKPERHIPQIDLELDDTALTSMFKDQTQL